MLTLDVALQRRPEVASRETPAGAVLIDMASGNCFELNTVGAALWAELASPHSLERICETLRARFDAPLAVIQRDVLALADDLRQAGLVDLSRLPSAARRP